MTYGVVRVGDTVRRPPRDASQLMRDALVHLERAGFEAAPRWLGLDEQGRDVLTWIDGETFTERGQMHPYIGDPPERIAFTGEQIAAVMSLLRRYHATFGDDVICHGDFGPWNIVWRKGLPFAVIDFDDVYRGDAADDVAYALRMFIGYGFAGGDAGRTRPAHTCGAASVRREFQRASHPRARVRPPHRLASPALIVVGGIVAMRAALAGDA